MRLLRRWGQAMRRALVDGEKLEARPKLRGRCPSCDSEMVAKCGRVKVWHWAHKRNPPCDPWWENETEWHRKWKDHFPADWQEFVAEDLATGEKHIADVKTPFGLVIEFQHSAIDPAEIRAREAFYGEMIWIVDGLRGSLDKGYFEMGLGRQPIQNEPLAYCVEWWGRSRLLHNWSQVGAKVYLDFGDEFLWRLVLFKPETRRAAVGPIQKGALVEDCLNGRPIRVLAKEESQT